VIACVVIGAILLFFFILLKRQQRINMALQKQNLLHEMTSLEKDRARIAADLHDELGPLLSLAKMRICSPIKRTSWR